MTKKAIAKAPKFTKGDARVLKEGVLRAAGLGPMIPKRKAKARPSVRNFVTWVPELGLRGVIEALGKRVKDLESKNWDRVANLEDTIRKLGLNCSARIDELGQAVAAKASPETVAAGPRLDALEELSANTRLRLLCLEAAECNWCGSSICGGSCLAARVDEQQGRQSGLIDRVERLEKRDRPTAKLHDDFTRNGDPADLGTPFLPADLLRNERPGALWIVRIEKGGTLTFVPEPDRPDEGRLSTILAADGSVAVHTCAARGCLESIGGELLMCPKHWRLIPGALRRKLVSMYRAGDTDAARIAVEIVVQRLEQIEKLRRKHAALDVVELVGGG